MSQANEQVQEAENNEKPKQDHKKAIAYCVGEMILESNEKIEKTLEELSLICKKATEK